MLVTISLFHPSLTLPVKAGAYQSGPPTGPHSQGRLASSLNIRLVQKWLGMTNTLAYYDKIIITVIEILYYRASILKTTNKLLTIII